MMALRRFTAHRHEVTNRWYVFDHLAERVYVAGYETEAWGWQCANSLEREWEAVCERRRREEKSPGPTTP